MFLKVSQHYHMPDKFGKSWTQPDGGEGGSGMAMRNRLWLITCLAKGQYPVRMKAKISNAKGQDHHP
jgi:hypothetical protein